MLTVKIHSIKKKYIMSEDDFWYIKDHLDEELSVMSLTYDSEGKLWSIAVYKPREDGGNDCISLFMGKRFNDIKFTLNGSIYGG